MNIILIMCVQCPLLKNTLVKKLLNNECYMYTPEHTLQSDSKTHVHTLQRFDELFKKKCQICVIVVFNNVNTVRSEM